MTTLTLSVIALLFGASTFNNLSMAGDAATAGDTSIERTMVVADNNDEQNLNNNKCLSTLQDTDKIMVSAAFHNGGGGFGQLQELLDRKPWGHVSDPVMNQELDTLLKQKSPFLIVTMTKKQALLLESHRDLIKWILIQSTEKACA